jgi:hypothetical protein
VNKADGHGIRDFEEAWHNHTPSNTPFGTLQASMMREKAFRKLQSYSGVN